MYINDRNNIIIQDLYARSLEMTVLTPILVRDWLNDFDRIDNSLKIYNRGPEVLQIVNSSKGWYEDISVLYKNNALCEMEMQKYPGQENELELLKWVCKNRELMDEMTGQIIELLEEIEIKEAENQIKFTQTTGEHVNLFSDDENKNSENTIFIPTNSESFISEYNSLSSSVAFCDLMWALYFSKLEQYNTVTHEEMMFLPEDHQDNIHYLDLEYHLHKRGFFLDSFN